MDRVMIGMAGAALVALSGCASSRTAQLTELRAAVVRLDTRLAAVERRSMNAPGPLPQPAETDTSDWDTFETKWTNAPASASARSAGARARSTPSTRTIQQALKNAGYYDERVDGKIGPKTMQAVRLFQRSHGLAVDGEVGPKTWAKLSQFLEE